MCFVYQKLSFTQYQPSVYCAQSRTERTNGGTVRESVLIWQNTVC